MLKLFYIYYIRVLLFHNTNCNLRKKLSGFSKFSIGCPVPNMPKYANIHDTHLHTIINTQAVDDDRNNTGRSI